MFMTTPAFAEETGWNVTYGGKKLESEGEYAGYYYESFDVTTVDTDRWFDIALDEALYMSEFSGDPEQAIAYYVGYYNSLIESIGQDPQTVWGQLSYTGSRELSYDVMEDGDYVMIVAGVTINGNTYISFPAVRYDEEKVFAEMEEKLKTLANPIIGLNNAGDILFMKKHPEYRAFADIYMYLPNREAALLLKEEVPSLVGGYLWVERESYEEPWPFTPTIASDYHPPLFISRSCYRHDGLGLDCKGCTRHHTFRAEQNGRNYTVFVDNCNTIVKES